MSAARNSELGLFILRSQVLALYRSFIRTCRQIPASNRGEVMSEVRREFRSQQDPSKPRDAYAVKYLLSDGRTKLKMLQEMIGFRT
ncbi:hypothetical protein MNEG_12268 [Monoraphidium neglectum]|uniref:LYR motif-containing protein 2 n=1 Tax=Monoraphidium neglectum TaxID=145388 RepID=A0A0D2LW51_9CHLO|nr:hypothetical protein MNEG_12268 [Monoraphidium neglectum]KIY95694.1 hypothetical protein MNEG_12268 [Monoraphidium neglectum]|eukprot:XP_013894714.1 hypothetical protein MNEG_12268 [Monoraphidium neglectum]